MTSVTTEVDVDEARAELDELVERAENGEDIVITVADRPQVRLVPVAKRAERERLPGDRAPRS